MDLMGGLSGMITIVLFVIFAAGVMKVFQIATTLSEIKDLLTALKYNAPIGAPMGPGASLPLAQSGEEMLRAALSLELDHPVNPTSIELGNKN
jgi:hypothetical protein